VNTDLIPYTENLPDESLAPFFRKLTEQLAKDLYPVKWGDVSKTLTPREIILNLEESVRILIEEQNSSLGSILYRIDIPEGKIRALMANTPSSERVKVLSAQIIEREAKKVWMRMHYSAPETGSDT
jgi:hypothetical protein